MFRRDTVLPALLASFGVFVVTVALLPRRGTFTFQGSIDYFFKSRENWELPFLFAAGTFCVLVGIAALFRPRATAD